MQLRLSASTGFVPRPRRRHSPRA